MAGRAEFSIWNHTLATPLGSNLNKQTKKIEVNSVNVSIGIQQVKYDGGSVMTVTIIIGNTINFLSLWPHSFH